FAAHTQPAWIVLPPRLLNGTEAANAYAYPDHRYLRRVHLESPIDPPSSVALPSLDSPVDRVAFGYLTSPGNALSPPKLYLTEATVAAGHIEDLCAPEQYSLPGIHGTDSLVHFGAAQRYCLLAFEHSAHFVRR